MYVVKVPDIRKKESTEGNAFIITSNRKDPPCEKMLSPASAFLMAVPKAAEAKECPTATHVILMNLIPFMQSRWSLPIDFVDSNLLPFEYSEYE
jgi:hypothetical protein